MNSYTHPSVLVVGAGPVGLVAALTLLQNGIPVRIIEKDPNPRAGQRGPGIWPRSLELFNFLNVPDVNDLGQPVPPIRSYKPGTLETLKDSSMVPYMEPTPAIPFSDEGITAVLAKNEVLETVHIKWMIGADGAKGVVRKQLGLTFLGETRDDTHIVIADICLKGAGLDREHWHRIGSFNTQAVTLRPTDEVGEDGWQALIVGHDLEHSKIAQSEELIFETIASIVPTEITFKKLVWVSEFRPNIRMVNKFSDGRVFVAGDAAHVHSPTGGQGLNSGIQDAFNLGWKIALVEKGLADKSLLDTYNEERLPVISEMLDMTTSILNHTITSGDMTARRSPKLFMLGINCRFSSIVLDEFVTPVEGKPINAYGVLDEGHLEAGDRAPDAPKLLHIQPGDSGETTLFSHYKASYHTVLVFAPSAADATPILAALESRNKSVVRTAVISPSSAPAVHVACPADLVLLDQGGHAYSAYLVEASQTKV
ncbi:hypothetical protein AZE42_05778, partial [Rhizopogon vesiculosus]